LSYEPQSASAKAALAHSQGRVERGWLPDGIGALCEMFRASLQADLCLIALSHSRASVHEPHRANAVYLRQADGSGGRSALGARLMLRPADGAAIHSAAGSNSRRTGSQQERMEVGNNEARQRLAALADVLGVSSMMTVPLGEGDKCVGRVYVGSNKQRYSSGDILPLLHCASYGCSLIASIRLAERLANEVALQERRRISLDLHDSAIQLYIALKLGLEAMHRRLRQTEFASELDYLIKIANDGIGELRQYVTKLKNAGARKRVSSLLREVRMLARKFAEFYGIEAQVIAQTDIPVNAPLQNEVLQILREGLSNIRRHTHAERAIINLREQQGRLFLELINDKARQAARQEFYPRSIGERAMELGGRVDVRHDAGNRTVVAVELPLHRVGQ
jgi:signal transduction histidine kinase